MAEAASGNHTKLHSRPTWAIGFSWVRCKYIHTFFTSAILTGEQLITRFLRNGPLTIYRTDNFDRDAVALFKQGYAAFGSSSFNGAANRVPKRQLNEQADKLSAELVLASSRYTNTVSGAMPLMVSNNSASVTDGNATVCG